MATKKPGKAYEIISENPKMDTSGMAGKPMEYPAPREWTPPPMRLKDMMEKRERATSKKPEKEDDYGRGLGCY